MNQSKRRDFRVNLTQLGHNRWRGSDRRLAGHRCAARYSPGLFERCARRQLSRFEQVDDELG